MTDRDRQHAQDQLGLDTPEEVETARIAGLFGLERGNEVRSGPMTVWRPTFRYFNPERQPRGDGRWVFHAEGDRVQADLNFGGQESELLEYNFTDNNHPSAQDIWDVRQTWERLLPEEFEEDPTDGINIAWVPDESDPNPVLDSFKTPTPEHEENAEEGRRAGQRDPNTRLIHQPTNPGQTPAHDQTGSETAEYHTHEIDGTRYTIDRERARAPNRELHKTWIVDKNGQWRQYASVDQVNWDDSESVDKINKWREQALKRAGWPLKRLEDRKTYTDEEREWVMDKIQAAEGTTTAMIPEELVAEFNERFSSERNEPGLMGLGQSSEEAGPQA